MLAQGLAVIQVAIGCQVDLASGNELFRSLRNQPFADKCVHGMRAVERGIAEDELRLVTLETHQAVAVDKSEGGTAGREKPCAVVPR